MKVLLVAEQGFVGDALAQRFQQRGRECLIRDLESLSLEGDLRSFLLKQKIVLVVHTALFTLPIEQALAYLQQDTFLKLLNAAQALSLPFIHLSSSYVFNAHEGGRYKESDMAEPNTEQGQAYRRIEGYVRKHIDTLLILRVGALFSEQGDNLLTNLLRQFKQGGEVSLSLHGHSAPVCINDFTRVMGALVDQLCCGVSGWEVKVWGDYHYVSSDPTTHYHFAESILAVMAQFTLTDQVSLIGVEEVDYTWQYPLLNCNKILSAFGIKQMPWRAAIVEAVKNYFQEVEHE